MTLTAAQLKSLRRMPVSTRLNRVQEAIDLAGGTQRDLARKSGVSFTHVADIARGRWSTTSVRTANRLATALGCEIKDLFPPLPENARLAS